MHLTDFIHMIERIAPVCGAAEWDNSGVQVVSRCTEIHSVAVALDPSEANIEKAVSQGADFFLAHHPLAFKPQPLSDNDSYFRSVSQLITNDICLYSAHTSLDANPAGPVGWLAESLKLQNCKTLEPTAASMQHRIIAPSADSGSIPAVIAGSIRYRHIQGIGHEFEFDTEDIVYETAADHIRQVLPAGTSLLKAEERAGRRELGLGISGSLPCRLSWHEFVQLLEKNVERTFWTTCGPVPETVETVAYCTGSGSSLAETAFARGADVFITGDVKYHTALDTTGCIIDVGHFSLEEEMMRRFAALLAAGAPDLDITFLPSQDPIRLHPVHG